MIGPSVRTGTSLMSFGRLMHHIDGTLDSPTVARMHGFTNVSHARFSSCTRWNDPTVPVCEPIHSSPPS